MNRAPSPPTKGYQLIDVRSPFNPISTVTKERQDNRPPSPAESDDSSKDVFDEPELVDVILSGLNKPMNHKSLPTYILYDKKGLQLFDQITTLDDEYYLTSAEHNILVNHSEEIISHLKDGCNIFELGSGSLRKTQVLLQAIEKSKKNVSYYALDLDQFELEKSLSTLGEFQYVQLFGLLGTYDQGIPWISSHFSGDAQKCFLWLGSSIGNQDRLESSLFLHRLQNECMVPSDLIVVGFDKRNAPKKVELAYDDTKGVTREFIMNGLDNVNRVMGDKSFINREWFRYHSIYQEKHGRHLSHYEALKDMVLTYKNKRSIHIKKGELIHVECSYKYSLDEIKKILAMAEININTIWVDSKDQYRLVLGEKPSFLFQNNIRKIVDQIMPSENTIKDEPLDCYDCTTGMLKAAKTLLNNNLNRLSLNSVKPSLTPSLYEWQELWKSWDLVCNMIDHRSMLFEKPIDLRHPFIFYYGHIPAFVDIQISKHQIDRQPLTEPAYFSDIFERGIDPDMEDPTQCHPHSEVPNNKEDWPAYDVIMKYQASVRERVDRILMGWEIEGVKQKSQDWVYSRKRHARILWMCFEHTAMHLETMLYMLVQSPNISSPDGIALPRWVKAHDQIELNPLSDSPWINLSPGTVKMGHNDKESDDDNLEPIDEFGWDNENPELLVQVGACQIQSRPVTNGEFYAYLQKTNHTVIPNSWLVKGKEVYIKTVFGPCPLKYAQHWPIQTSFVEAKKYAEFKGARLPKASELILFREQVPSEQKWPNIGFNAWTPTDVDNETVHYLGDVWEWTETKFIPNPGFETSKIYPGYSSDFFDGKHNILLGGSWATHPRIAERKSFTNWYQTKYDYVFGGFRLCK